MSFQILTRDVPPRSAWTLEQAGIHPLLSRLFAARGILSPEELDDGLAKLLAPSTLMGTQEAATLLANAIAQAQALMLGKDDEGGHKHFKGNRPSTFLLLDELTPASLGALIALRFALTWPQRVRRRAGQSGRSPHGPADPRPRGRRALCGAARARQRPRHRIPQPGSSRSFQCLNPVQSSKSLSTGFRRHR